MAKGELFRGYRSAPVAFSGALALLAAALQTTIVGDPLEAIDRYLTLWIVVASLSFAMVVAEMGLRIYLTRSHPQVQPARLAFEQFLPPIIAGALITAVIVRHVPLAVVLLPGLWQILYGLGIFASARMLPRQGLFVALFYLAAGVVVLMLSADGRSLSPWCMGIPFGLGQLATAAILYWILERRT